MADSESNSKIMQEQDSTRYQEESVRTYIHVHRQQADQHENANIRESVNQSVSQFLSIGVASVDGARVNIGFEAQHVRRNLLTFCLFLNFWFRLVLPCARCCCHRRR